MATVWFCRGVHVEFRAVILMRSPSTSTVKGRSGSLAKNAVAEMNKSLQDVSRA